MIEYPTLKLAKHERTKKIFFNIKTQSSYLETCVFQRGTIIYNNFVMNEQHSEYLKNDHKCDNAKQFLKQYFFELFLKNPSVASISLSWKG